MNGSNFFMDLMAIKNNKNPGKYNVLRAFKVL